MILPKKQDAKHKAWLYRLLSTIYNDPYLASVLCFKGGTSAAMRGFLDRFSIDLDFDYLGKKTEIKETSKKLEKIFKKLGLEIKDKSLSVPQYFLRYPSKIGARNTLKIDITYPAPKSNKYETIRFKEIDRIITTQTIETMFANKLVALIERYEKNKSIAGRDLYDIHHFFFNGFDYNSEVIKERRQKKVIDFLIELVVFIKKEITQTIIDQDINHLIQYDKFKKLRLVIKKETLMFLNDEIERLK
ncbi:nucleotidyl transferase AbiEii/AbiGii toxin family protein [bacterium]|jgi:predicted nucleotidyltransferase component of viral defense system|nr:nucleotidyl transferase AbiEii/AbiGii toxin family protein [bacterium]MBT4121986.1 nucleotidyl transferase AbiEii/AbiGii toxin family protein [bacterium]MBT4334845.1 nucleotidyl transferase AbiEii/AbiGii toxin family protein [bacterium]MBT4495866.1 nucleotidyl transferase AbiEii/AbiGii toxin family protein [bacterium]MBT4763537.1 nucleotidyl transferase AbiEii/AbiGii toxin family protein [bacterium]